MREVVTALRAYRSSRGLPPRAPLVMEPPPHPAVSALDAVAAAPRRRRGRAHHHPARGRSLDRRRARRGADRPGRGAQPPGARARKAETELARAEGKLANPAFVGRAPAHLVEAERDKVARYATERDALAERIAALGD